MHWGIVHTLSERCDVSLPVKLNESLRNEASKRTKGTKERGKPSLVVKNPLDLYIGPFLKISYNAIASKS